MCVRFGTTWPAITLPAKSQHHHPQAEPVEAQVDNRNWPNFGGSPVSNLL